MQVSDVLRGVVTLGFDVVVGRYAWAGGAVGAAGALLCADLVRDCPGLSACVGPGGAVLLANLAEGLFVSVGSCVEVRVGYDGSCLRLSPGPLWVGFVPSAQVQERYEDLASVWGWSNLGGARLVFATV